MSFWTTWLQNCISEAAAQHHGRCQERAADLGSPRCLQILSDTKDLQKEINSLTGKLDRTFAVTDEMVFKVQQGFSLHLTEPVCFNLNDTLVALLMTTDWKKLHLVVIRSTDERLYNGNWIFMTLKVAAQKRI